MQTINRDVARFTTIALWVLLAAGWVGFTRSADAGPNTTFPVIDTFEQYTNNTPLIDGTNGWYGSDSAIIVQSNTAYAAFGSTNSAKIPLDSTLSNRFQSAASTNVWLQMDVKVALYDSDSTNPPVVLTNAAAMFYLASNGYFVVHNGPANPSTNSAGWVTLTSNITSQAAASNANGSWVRINIHQNYARTNWTFFANYVLLTNNIGFINTSITNFTGFDLYNGDSTTYLDNVYVTTTNPPALATNGNNWLPCMAVSNLSVTNSVMRGKTATSNSFNVWRTNGYYALSFTNTASTNWLTPNPSSTTITNATSRVDIVYSTTNLAAGTYTGQVAITGFDSTFGFTALNSPQTFTVVMQVMELTLNTTVMTNSIMFGRNAFQQSFSISNSGGGAFNYTNTSLTNWITVAPATGALGAGVSQLITNTYPTTGLALGTHTGTVRVASTSGGGDTQTVSVVMHVMGWQVPAGLTNNVMRGHSSSQTFNVVKLGGGELSYTISTNSYNWVSLSQTGGVLTNASSQTITVNYATNLPNGVTTGFLTVASTSGGGITQDVSLTVNVSELLRDPGGLTNTIMPGYVPPAQSFMLANGGAGTIDYQVASDAVWVTPATNTGTLGAGQTNTIILTYGPTTGWQLGTSNATVTITSTNGGGTTQTVAIVFYVVDLMPPTGVTASKGAYADKIRVNWTAVSNALGYQVWRNTVSDTTTATNLAATTDTVYDDTTALQDVTYYYWLKATNILGVSAFSASDTGTRSLGAPPAPTGVIASDGTYTDRVAVAWQAAQGAIGYEVWRNIVLDSNAATKVSSPDPVGASYNDLSAAGGVRYYYWVKSKGSNNVTGVFSTPDAGWRALSASGITASEGLRREIRITWDAVSGATRYELWRNGVEDIASALMLLSGTSLSYLDLDVEPSIIYFYWVKVTYALGTMVNGPDTGWCSGKKWDFTGDGRADAWYYNPGGGRWYVVPTSNVIQTVVFGGPGMAAVPEDYDGDGKADPAVYEESSGTWMVMLSANGYAVASAGGFGGAGFTAVPGDYDGDGKADPAIYEETSGAWHAMLSGRGYALESATGYGAPGYRSVPADYDGDGKTDPAVYEESSGNWFLMPSSGGYVPQYYQFGAAGYTPVPGEYNNLGYAEIAVYHQASGYWFIRTPTGDIETVQFGRTGYIPISADYDGDGFEDEAVFYRDSHDALWYLLRSRDGLQIISGRESRP